MSKLKLPKNDIKITEDTTFSTLCLNSKCHDGELDNHEFPNCSNCMFETKIGTEKEFNEKKQWLINRKIEAKLEKLGFELNINYIKMN